MTRGLVNTAQHWTVYNSITLTDGKPVTKCDTVLLYYLLSYSRLSRLQKAGRGQFRAASVWGKGVARASFGFRLDVKRQHHNNVNHRFYALDNATPYRTVLCCASTWGIDGSSRVPCESLIEYENDISLPDRIPSLLYSGAE